MIAPPQFRGGKAVQRMPTIIAAGLFGGDVTEPPLCVVVIHRGFVARDSRFFDPTIESPTHCSAMICNEIGGDSEYIVAQMVVGGVLRQAVRREF